MRAGRLDVHENVGGCHRFTHRGGETRCDVEVVDLEHRVDEVDERKTCEIRDARRRAVFAEVVARAVEAKTIVAEPNRLGAVYFWLPDDDLDVQAGALL